ncbi:MAG: helix-turn-helix domain-containing protein [Halobacteriaceae archaeon]
MSLLETEVPVREVVTTDPEKARALESDVRAKVLDMLADDAMTIEEMHAELQRRGDGRAETTVRHHVNVLREAGMVEIARLEDAGGGTRKYYKSNTRVFSYDLPEGAEETLDGALARTREELRETVDGLLAEHGDAVRAVAEEMKPCEYCETQHYEEFIVRELLNRALLELNEAGEFDELLD